MPAPRPAPPSAPDASAPNASARAADAATRLLLDVALVRSGLPLARFATEICLRDRRTVQRWRAGRARVPRPVRARLCALFAPAEALAGPPLGRTAGPGAALTPR